VKKNSSSLSCPYFVVRVFNRAVPLMPFLCVALKNIHRPYIVLTLMFFFLFGGKGEWKAAREDYLTSSALFQTAYGFRRGRSMSPRLDGAVFAASNAALMLAQLGQTEDAVKEMQNVARRAPGSADMRAALAALYYARGDSAAAEGEWDFACSSITVGCSKFKDEDWLSRIRRWPPVMVRYMKDFLALESTFELSSLSTFESEGEKVKERVRFAE
jgi:tetratricopeptide (TPR) repeat protein